MGQVLLFVLGASGAGKTAVLEVLAGRDLEGVRLHHFDSVGVPSPEEMEREHGSGEGWQAATTRHWVETMLGAPGEVQVLEGQTRPSTIRSLLEERGVRSAATVLLDCSAEVRRARLAGPRAQPELANADMDCWAAYLRGQADALGIRVIDTSSREILEVADELEALIAELRS